MQLSRRSSKLRSQQIVSLGLADDAVGLKKRSIAMTSMTTPTAGEFSGKRVLVTGGTRGIGRAIVARFMRSGARMMTTSRTLPTDEATVEFIQADVSKLQAIAQVSSDVLS